MTDAVQKLFEEAMKLSPEERERLARQLLDRTTATNDDMDPAERAELLEALEEAEQDIEAGRVVEEDEVWRRLRAIG